MVIFSTALTIYVFDLSYKKGLSEFEFERVRKNKSKGRFKKDAGFGVLISISNCFLHVSH